MEKTSIVHTRISPTVKDACDDIFKKLGITTSYAISLFLSQVALRKGIPFDLSLPEDDSIKFAESISIMGGIKPSSEAKEIIKLYNCGLIDLKTAEKIIRKLN